MNRQEDAVEIDSAGPDLPSNVIDWVAAASLAFTAGVTTVNAIRARIASECPERPLAAAIQDSGAVDQDHQIKLELMNLGVHGVYVERMFISHSRESDVPLTVEPSRSRSIGLGDDKLNPKGLPLLLPAGARMAFLLITPLFLSKGVVSGWGRLRVDYMVLGLAEKAAQEMKVEVAVRR